MAHKDLAQQMADALRIAAADQRGPRPVVAVGWKAQSPAEQSAPVTKALPVVTYDDEHFTSQFQMPNPAY